MTNCKEITFKTIKISFLASKTERTYGSRGAPIKRVVFSPGDEISLRSAEKYTVVSTEMIDGLMTYDVGLEKKIDELIFKSERLVKKPNEK